MPPTDAVRSTNIADYMVRVPASWLGRDTQERSELGQPPVLNKSQGVNDSDSDRMGLETPTQHEETVMNRWSVSQTGSQHPDGTGTQQQQQQQEQRHEEPQPQQGQQ